MNGYEYVYGSTARKRVEEEDPYIINRIHRKKVRIKRFQKNKRKVIFVTLIGFAIIMFVMVRYGMILNLNYKIADMNRQYERIVAQNSALNVQLKEKTSLSAIYDRAVNDLGMIKADGDHVAYFNIDREDAKVVANDYILEREQENHDPVTLVIDKIRLFLNLK
ncbi:MAG TPA: hypothetical protein DDZ89_19695 [Clostridiales bacterium]|mgnify:CR=1 FL=1|nr:hypothetical protein [Clostridiales bacterium]